MCSPLCLQRSLYTIITLLVFNILPTNTSTSTTTRTTTSTTTRTTTRTTTNNNYEIQIKDNETNYKGLREQLRNECKKNF